MCRLPLSPVPVPPTSVRVRCLLTPAPPKRTTPRARPKPNNSYSRNPAATCSSLRYDPHLVWGPGDEQLVARIIGRAASGSLRLIGSGAALVDSTYVDNAADAIAASLEQAEIIDGRALVISNGEPRPVAELLRGLCHAAGFELPLRGVPTWVAKAGGSMVDAAWAAARLTRDPPMTRFLAEQLSTAHWYDQRETHTLLGWTPTVSIDDGFGRLAAWFRTGQDR